MNSGNTWNNGNKTESILPIRNKQSRIYLPAFAVPFFIMLFLFLLNGIYPFGDQSFFCYDLEHQYYPFLLEFRRKVLAGDSLFFSWNTGLGSNFFTVYAYYLASPTNWLCVLVPEAYLMEFMSYMVIFKIGLCGLTFSIYLSKHFQTSSRVIVLVSLFYALSGYMNAYNWNVMWLDCLILTPLIILGLEELVQNKKYKLYCVCLALSIFSNYYLSIMICIYLVLYFFIVLLPAAADKWKALIRFAVCSLLSGLSAAILLIPAIKALPYASRTAAAFPTSLEFYSNPLEVLTRHFMNVIPDVINFWPDFWPNIYCSVAVFILFPLYVLNTGINRREKTGKIILLGILFLSFSVNILNYLWHGFTIPRALPARQSFLYILLLLTVCLESYLHIKEVSLKRISVVFFLTAIYFIWAKFFFQDEDITTEALLSSIGFLIVYGLFLMLYLQNKLKTRIIAYLFCFIMLAEAAGNSMATGIITTLRSQSLHENPTVSAMVQNQTADSNGKYYRYDKSLRETDNDSLLQNYPSLSVFSSTGSGLMNHYYHKYGMYGHEVHITSEGATPFIYGLLSGGYSFSSTYAKDETFSQTVSSVDSTTLRKNNYAVPLGFCIYPTKEQAQFLISDIETTLDALAKDDGLNPFERQNLLAQNLGAAKPLFTTMTCEDYDGYSTFTVPEDSHIYVYYDTGNYSEISVSINGQELSSHGEAHYNHILNLGYQVAGTVVQITGVTDSSDTRLYRASAGKQLNISAGGIHVDVLDELMSDLNQNTMTIYEMDSDSLSANLTADDEGYVILSIPYDPGFTVMVDNTKTEPLIFDDMMLAIPVTAGEHDISLSFYPAGLNTGILISAFSILCFILAIILEKRAVAKKR